MKDLNCFEEFLLFCMFLVFLFLHRGSGRVADGGSVFGVKKHKTNLLSIKDNRLEIH